MRQPVVLLPVILLLACGQPREGGDQATISPLPPRAEAISLLGDTLCPPELPAEVLADREAELAKARAEYEADPSDVDAVIWYGRRTAYLSDYREAIEIYSDGIERNPNDPRLYRHRGHRYISVRVSTPRSPISNTPPSLLPTAKIRSNPTACRTRGTYPPAPFTRTSGTTSGWPIT